MAECPHLMDSMPTHARKSLPTSSALRVASVSTVCEVTHTTHHLNIPIMSDLSATIALYLLTKEEHTMTITYTLWQGSQLLAVNQKASKPEEILAVIKELEKLGKGFTYNIREVEVK